MPQPPQPSPPKAPPPDDSRLLTWITFGIIAAWGGLLALGSYLGLDNKTPSFDWRRGGVMLVCSGFFLMMWLLAMGSRAKRLRRSALIESSSAAEGITLASESVSRLAENSKKPARENPASQSDSGSYVPRSRTPTFVATMLLTAPAFFISPVAGLGLVVLSGMAITLVRSALEDRQEGWPTVLTFGVLLLLPGIGYFCVFVGWFFGWTSI